MTGILERQTTCPAWCAAEVAEVPVTALEQPARSPPGLFRPDHIQTPTGGELPSTDEDQRGFLNFRSARRPGARSSRGSGVSSRVACDEKRSGAEPFLLTIHALRRLSGTTPPFSASLAMTAR